LASLPPVPLEATLPPSGIHRTCLIGKHGDMASPWHGPVLNKLYKQGDQPKPETKRRIRCGPIRYGIQKRHSAAHRRVRWRVAHEISPQDAIRGKPRDTCPDARARSRRRRPASLLPRCPYARTTGPAGAHTYTLSGRKHRGNLSHFLGFQPCGCPRVGVESKASLRVWWCAVPSRSARTYQHRRAGGRADVAVGGRFTR
jgi:hypothetical protein